MPKTHPERYSDPMRATRTRAETGRLVGCATNMVDSLITNGSLEAVEVGNRRLPTVKSIEKLLGKPIEELEAPLRVAEGRRARSSLPDALAARTRADHEIAD